MRALWFGTSPSIDPSLHDVLMEARDRPLQPLGGRELRTESAFAALFLLATGLLLAFLPAGRDLDVAPAVALTLLYACASRVEFLSGAGATVPTQLVLVPMLFLLPLPAVPLFVAAGLLLGRLPSYLSRRTPPARAVVELGDALYSLGPVLVLGIAGATTPHFGDWPLYAAALAAQFTGDTLFSTLRSRIGLGVAPGFALQELAWICGIDALLAGVGMLAALATRSQDFAYLLVLPLLVAMALSARDRRLRIDLGFELWQAYRGSVHLLDRVVSADGREATGRSRGVVDLAMQVADQLDLDAEARVELEFAALLHDVGKLEVDNEILRKRGPLTQEEFTAIRTHTIEGHRMLAEVGGLLGRVGEVVRACHERWDGGGYPDGVAGEAIPLAARIVFACDAFHAMTVERPYRAARTPDRALAELHANAGTQFDPAVVAAITRTLGLDDLAPGALPTPGRRFVPAWHTESPPVASDEGLVGFGADGAVHSINSAAVRLLGWPAEDAIERRFHELVHHAYPNGAPYPAAASPIEGALRDGIARDDRIDVFWRRDGTPLGVRYSVRPVVEHGVRTGGVLSFKPLYARSPAEEALRLGEELYRSLARNLHQSSVLLFDHDLRVLVAEGESLATGDIPYEAMSRRRLRDVLSPATWALLRQPARAALRGERLTFDLPSDDGEQLYKVTVGPIRDDQGAVQAGLLVAEDVTHSRNQAERLTRMAHHDELTGLANRSAFHEAADRALRRATRGDTRSALLFVDLDGLKSINDRLGHEAGDELLRSTALRLKGAVREIDTVARLGGDEFAVLLESVRSDREVAAAAERLVRAVAEPLRIGGLHEAHATASIGIAIQGSIDDSGAELLRQADAAMYRAKGLGGNRYHFFDAASDMRVSMRREAGMALAQALERREFELHYQPEISLDTGAVVAVEALVRWHHPQRGLLHPGEFLAEAERRGIMDAIDEWVVGEACVQGMIWSQEGLPPFRIAVNLSTAALRRSDFEDIVAHHLDRAGLSASRLEFELPEKILAEDDDLATEQALRRLRTRGSRIVIDRFGTGRSPLGRLRTFPVDAIKMDRTFTQELGAERAMAGGLIDLAHRLRLEVIAGAVETQDQLQILRENGCDRAVGHAITAPAPAGALTTWLLEREATRSRPAGPPHRDDPGPGGGGGRRFARRRR